MRLATTDGDYLASIAMVDRQQAGTRVSSDWYLATLVPESSLLGPMHRLDRTSIIASIVALAIALGVALLFSWNVVRMRRAVGVARAEARSAEARAKQLGSYQLGFDGGEDENGAVRGKLRDTGGPLDVAGTLALTPAPGYLLQGTVATRPSASSLLQRQIAFLGSPDAAGRRAFAQEATF